MSAGQFNRFVRKTATKKKTGVLICCVAALSTLSFMYYSSPSSGQESDKVLHRNTRAMKSMIDMRGFADTEGLCPHAGFFRNKTDCTQFYRCVDFNRNGKHTVFRFMCGPMTVFDPSRSLCTGPRMAIPPCPNDPPTPTPPPPPTTPSTPFPPCSFPSRCTETSSTTTSSTTTSSTTTPSTPTPSTPTPSTPTPSTPTASTPSPPPPPPPTPTPTPSTPFPPCSFPSRCTETSSTTTPSPPPPTPTETPTPSTPFPPCPFSSRCTETSSTTTPSTPTPSPPPPPTTSTQACNGILIAEDENVRQTVNTKSISIPPNSISGIISCQDPNKIVIFEGGSEKTIYLPSGTISIITTNQSEGEVTNISNGIFTTNSTKISLPQSSTYEVIQYVEGRGVNRTTLFITKEKIEIVVPEMSIYGQVRVTNNQVTNIGGWRFTTEYLSINQKESISTIIGIISNVTTLQASVSTTTSTTFFERNSQYISGIITVGGSSADEPPVSSLPYTLSVKSEEILTIIPQKGRGDILLNQEGSSNSSIFPITPGTILTIQPPVGSSGMVTNLLQSTYTSETTEITFPAGSTVSVCKIRIDGKLEKISVIQVSSTVSVSTTTQSTVGIVQTSTDGSVRQIGTGQFGVKLMDGSPDQTYVGILNLNSLIKKEYRSVAGIIQIGDPTFLNYQQSTITQTIQILPGTTTAILVSGEIQVTEEDGTSIKQTSFSIPSGGILGIVTLKNGGEITGISNSYFTTNSTQVIFRFGVRFGIVITNSDGTMRLQNPVDATGKTTITVPVGSVFGELALSSLGEVIGIGNAYFLTRNLVTGFSLFPTPSTLLGTFGVIYFSEKFNLSQSVVTSSTRFNSGLKTISAIVHVTAGNRKIDSIDSLLVTQNSSFAIIPKAGEGIVSVREGGSSTKFNFTVLPGQIFGIFNVQDTKVTNINNGFFTTSATSISFGSGTIYGIIKIGLDGSVIALDKNESQDDLFITVSDGSTVGNLNLKNDNGRESILSIGGAPFVIRNSTFQSTQTTANSALGILGVDELFQTTPSTTTTSTITPSNITTTNTTTTNTTTTNTTTTNTTTTSTTTPSTMTPSNITTNATISDPLPPFSIDCTSDKPLQFPLDCSRFYQCVSNVEKRIIYVFSCLPGLYFDDVSSECRTPAEAVCKDKSVINDTTNSLDGPGGILRLDCNGKLYRYPLNCNNFYTCFKDDEGHENINVFACAAGLVFDDSSSRCLLPQETLSCDDSNNFFKSPSFVFQLREEIDTVSILSKSKDIFEQQKTNWPKLGELSDLITPKLPHQSGRGASQNKMRIRMNTHIENPK